MAKTALTCGGFGLRLCATKNLPRSADAILPRDQHSLLAAKRSIKSVGAQPIALALTQGDLLMLTHSRRSTIASIVMFALLLPMATVHAQQENKDKKAKDERPLSPNKNASGSKSIDSANNVMRQIPTFAWRSTKPTAVCNASIVNMLSQSTGRTPKASS